MENEIINTLKTKRNEVIKELQLQFEFKQVPLKVLMNDFVKYLIEEGYTSNDLISTKDINWAINKFHTDNSNNYEYDAVKGRDHLNQEIINAKKFL
jgi:hypothetical protein